MDNGMVEKLFGVTIIPAGSKVLIPKGTKLTSTHPRRKEFVAKKSYSVVVDHILTGWAVHLGIIVDGERRFIGGMGWREMEALCRQHGIKTSPPFDTAAYAKLMDLPEARVIGNDIWLPVQPPSVRWAGPGGYWVEAPMNAVKVKEAA